MLVAQLKNKLKRLGVEFNPSDLKADLEKKLEKALKAKEKEAAREAAEKEKESQEIMKETTGNERGSSETEKSEPAPVEPEKPRKIRVRHQEDGKEPEPIATVTYQGRKVLSVFSDGHTKSHFHCQMEGGITQHVPKSLFR